MEEIRSLRILPDYFDRAEAQASIEALQGIFNNLPNGKQKNNIEDLLALTESCLRKQLIEEEGQALIRLLDSTTNFLNDEIDVDRYNQAILDESEVLDSFPWFKVLIGILLAILAVALLAAAIALVVSLAVTTGPVAAIVAPVVLLFEKAIAFTASLSIAELTLGAVAGGALGTTAATGVVAGVNAVGAAVSGFFAGFFMKNSSFKGCMEDIKKAKPVSDNSGNSSDNSGNSSDNSGNPSDNSGNPSD